MQTFTRPAIALSLVLIIGCSSEQLPAQSPQKPSTQTAHSQLATMEATVTNVEATEQGSGTYTFGVTLRSPDTGCDQYADWWEVLTEDGDLLYRRILAHSHVDEQPFRRTGGPVSLGPNQSVIVRAHMHPQGYGIQGMQGTVSGGFEAVKLPEGFASDLANADPQPQGCAF